jgi:hypothetical protein
MTYSLVDCKLKFPNICCRFGRYLLLLGERPRVMPSVKDQRPSPWGGRRTMTALHVSPQFLWREGYERPQLCRGREWCRIADSVDPWTSL